MTSNNNKNRIVLATMLGAILAITVISTGFTNSAYASHNNVKVGCKDLAITLVTWDQLLGFVAGDDIMDIEHFLADEDITEVLLTVLIDRHLEDLLDDAEDECNNLDHDLEEVLEDLEFEVP